MTMTFNVAGNLAADPKFDTFGANRSVLVRLRVASDRWVTEAGTRTTLPEFYNVTLFGDSAELFRDAAKGDPVTIAGDVRPHTYTKDGVEVHTHNLLGKTASWQPKEAAKAARQQTNAADPSRVVAASPSR